MLAAAVLIALALVFAVRRFAGALVVPLHPLVLLGIGVLITATTLAVRRVTGVPRNVPFEAALSMALAVTLFSLALPGTAPLAILGLAMMTLAEETRAWSTLPPDDRLAATRSERRLCVAAKQTPSHDDEPHGQITHQLTRMQTADGGDIINARVAAAFEPGQRTTSIHVAFCPPFAVLPEVEFEQTDGPEARIKLGQLLPQGVRLDVKLAAPGPAVIEVAISAIANVSTEEA
jgi:hypothetical protein